MPEEEGLALYRAASRTGGRAPLLEIGSYCGKSAIYLGAVAEELGTLLYSIDHHRGSEEHQPGEGYHDERLTDADGEVDTLPEFRRTISGAGLEKTVIAIVGDSASIAVHWSTPLAVVFIDGGHSELAAAADLEGWSPHIVPGGLLMIHDVFPDPKDGGRPPFNIYRAALDSGRFKEIEECGSLRVLERVL
jgi:predicted O-methyltransferase YrrM